MLDPWQDEKLSGNLEGVHIMLSCLLGRLADKARGDTSEFTTKLAATLRRMEGDMRLAVDRAKKLEKKLAKAKKKAKRGK